jgi:hypothetical protein
MKILKKFLFSVLIFCVCLSTTFHFSSCQKETVVTKVDTLYDVKDGLVAYYNFNGGSLHDSSGYKNDITSNSAVPTTDRFGKQNNAYLFNGSSSFMRVPNNRSLTPQNITLFATFKVNGFNLGSCHGNEILGKGYLDGFGGNYLLRFNDVNTGCSDAPNTNNERFFAGIYGAVYQTDTIMVKTGIWYNLVYTYDGFRAKLYLNGELKSDNSVSIPYNSNTNDLFIGRHEDPLYPYYFNGVVDEVRIYNRALSINAIKQLYNSKE